jgi:ribonuclease HII
MARARTDHLIPTTEAEGRFWARGLRRVAGLDEVGRGAWAGPVYAAAVILPQSPDALASLKGVRDSKQLTPSQREALAARIVEVALAIGVGRGEWEEIDARGIVPATRLAMCRALEALALAPEALVIDALTLPAVRLPQDAFPHADALSLSVAAAGIIAKVSRDRWMVAVAEAEFPGYGFAQHKGYGTRQHQVALERLGICPIHRRSFRPIAILDS